MRIGIVNEYFPPFAPGGGEWSSLALAQALAQVHNVRVITPNYGAPAAEEMGGVHILRFPSPIKLTGKQMTVQIRWLANPNYYRRVYQAILAAAQKNPFDILHVQAKYSLPGAYWAARRLNIPIVYTVRDSLVICPTGQCLMEYDPVHTQCGGFRFWWQRCVPLYMARYMQDAKRPWRIRLALIWQQAHVRLFRAALKRVDGVIGVSAGILNIYRQAGLTLGRETAVIYNLPPPLKTVSAAVVTATRQKLALQNAPIILYAGKFSPGKGTQDLVTAADLLIDQYPTAQFLFAGHGPIRLNGPHTRNIGRLPHDQLLALYQLADIVVIPSVWHEPMSRVGLEAMAAGKPLIGTRVGGTPEQIEDGVTGLIIPRKDPSSLAQAINDLLINEAKRHQMGQAAQQLVQTRFSRQQTIENTLNFYQHLITRNINT